ncbi:hypothetical protein [Fusicatenibacter saccharivorans]|uniref:hypothetical protein n=1 Tax=Fusicatenibacter saccharivorans TaxID=1150298 RepID=UPI003F9021D6
MGKYEEAGRKALDWNLEYSGIDEMAILSLKVLDLIDEKSEGLSAKDAITVLEDAINIYLQLRVF